MKTENLSSKPITANVVNTTSMRRFNSISEIVKDTYFIKKVVENIIELREKRGKRPLPKPGYRYKRDWYDRMISEGHFNSFYFINNIEKIWLKKSSLSSETRHIIQFVCDKSFQQTLEFYAKQSEVPKIAP